MEFETLDSLSQATIEAEAKRQGVSVHRILDRLFQDGATDNFCQIYERLPNGKLVMRFDGKLQQPQDKYDHALVERVKFDLARTREAVARDAMISRLQHHFARTDSSLSETEARQRYLERLQKRR